MNTTPEITAASIQAAQEYAASLWELTDNGYPRQRCSRTNRHTGHNFQIYRGGTLYRWCIGH